MDDAPIDLDELAPSLRRADLTPDRKAEVEARVMRSVRRRRAARIGGAGLMAVAVLCAFWLASPFGGDSRPAPIVVAAAGQARIGDREVGPGTNVRPHDRIRIEAGGHVHADLGNGSVEAEGPHVVSLSPGEVVLHESGGPVAIDGSVRFVSPGCCGNVDGRAEVAVFEHTQITIVAGTVSLTEPRSACRFVELDPPTEPPPTEPPVPASPDQSAADRHERGTRRDSEESRAPPSALSQEVRLYRDALALRNDHPGDALRRFVQLRRRYSRGTLRQETDVRIIELLESLGRTRRLRREARAALERYPESPHAARWRAIIEPAP